MNELLRVNGDNLGKPSRVYELLDFAPVRPGALYVQIGRRRTVYHADGSIREEVASSETLLENMIRAYGGRVFHSPDIIKAYFETTDKAQECARSMFIHHGKSTEVSGTQLSIRI